jgi:hypothetical protein
MSWFRKKESSLFPRTSHYTVKVEIFCSDLDTRDTVVADILEIILKVNLHDIYDLCFYIDRKLTCPLIDFAKIFKFKPGSAFN